MEVEYLHANYRRAVPAEERLPLTLRFLGTGENYASLNNLFCLIQHENEWLQIALGFEEQWNSSHYLGAIDGKCFDILAPANSGTDFYSYESYFSIVRLGVADSDYRIIYTNVGFQGHISDGRVLKHTNRK
ncbi:uncharacterized protein LOC124556289 [Schistocerca americana]|uniref:uncharacterized protein LOC124556289 n=1 Tax=Schistocerca americana TaxID=7009 RepID=UPI001F503C9D|nr:uncharacterized protein LOC124556289 [Schistocerca americana]